MSQSEKISHNRFLESTLWKILGVVFLCILEFLIVGAAFTAVWSVALDNQSESKLIRDQMGNEVFDVVTSLSADNPAQTDPSQTNLRFYVEKVSSNGEKELLLDTTENESYLQKETFWLCIKPDSASPWLATEKDINELTSREWKNLSVYCCTVLLVTPFTAKDTISYTYQMANFAEKHGSFAIPAAVCFIVLFLLILVYEFCAAGHKQNHSEIVLAGIDHFPFDLMTVLMIILTIICMPAVSAILEQAYGIDQLNVQMAETLMLVFLAWSLVFFTYLMSLARRVKTGTVRKGTLIGWIWRRMVWFGKFLGSLIPEFWQRLLVYILYLIMQIAASAAIGGNGEILFFMVSAVIGGVALHSLWMQKQTCTAAEEICGGNLNYQVPERTISRMYGGMRRQAEYLNRISDTVSHAVDEQVKSERLKTELIANVGHDIRTPLTSIINYVDLLGREHTPEQEKEYVAVLSRQTERLRKLTEDVLEFSKADSGNVDVHLEKTSVAEIVDQAYGEYEEKMTSANLETVINVPEDLYVTADGKLLWRVLRNLLSNAAKYSAPHSRVYISAQELGDGQAVIEIKNMSREKLNISADELMERFIRGDSSRHSEGSGLGLDIARSLSSLMGGKLNIQIDGDLFKASVVLKTA
jgi:signal transduction histidine kinase